MTRCSRSAGSRYKRANEAPSSVDAFDSDPNAPSSKTNCPLSKTDVNSSSNHPCLSYNVTMSGYTFDGQPPQSNDLYSQVFIHVVSPGTGSELFQGPEKELYSILGHESRSAQAQGEGSWWLERGPDEFHEDIVKARFNPTVRSGEPVWMRNEPDPASCPSRPRLWTASGTITVSYDR